jgi:hypothetical protein
MKKTAFLFTFIMAMLIGNNALSQTTQVKIMDLAVTPLVNQNLPVGSDSVDVSLQFKVKNINLAQTVTLKMGTTQGGQEIKILLLPVVSNLGVYGVMASGTFHEITANTANVIIRMSCQQMNDTHWFTLFIRDQNGLVTGNIYSQK